jgi:hypothetical protein
MEIRPYGGCKIRNREMGFRITQYQGKGLFDQMFGEVG